MRKKLFSLILFSLVIALSSLARADEWIDNWVQQSTYSMPNTYNTQKRGYVSGGNLSVRYQQSNDHLVSITPPGFKKGCGGIDMWLGSINYLNADRLQEKFESIVTNALATYIFDLALNVTCEPCAKELKSLEAVIDRLNQLQLDDCKASKALVAYMKNETGQGDSQQNSEAISDFLISSGAQDLYNDVTDESNDKDVQTVRNEQGITKQEMVSGCPEQMRRVFFEEGTLLENLAEMEGMETSHVEIMRAFVGDVAISADLEYAAIAACPENNPTNIEAVIFGDLYTRDGAECRKIDGITIGGHRYESLFEWARENIVQIAESLRDKTPFDGENEVFINTMPEPLLVVTGIELMQQGDDFDVDIVADKYAYNASLVFAQSMMRDLYNDIRTLLKQAQTVSFNQRGADGAGQTNCNHQLKAEAQRLSKAMVDDVSKFSSGMSDEYRKVISEIMESYRYAELVKDQYDDVEGGGVKKVMAQ